MKLFKFKPTRDQQAPSVEVVADLDALESTPVAFNFMGETHILKPIETGQLFNVYGAFSQVDALMKKDGISGENLIEVYTKLFSTVCETITRKHVEKMTQKQVAALYTLVYDSITGRAQAKGSMDSAEKKNPVNP